MPEVVLGLSDGVDSAVAAYILKKQGFAVRGVYMDIAGAEAREAAMRSAAQNDIPLRIIASSQALMQRVCRPFAAEYLRGRTPNPCVICNPEVKLAALEEAARETGAQFIATGHYAKSDGRHLYMGAQGNDQSYMLQRVSGAQAERLLLPLGDKNKAGVRALARRRGLSAAARPDSRDNCFLKGLSCAQWIERHAPDAVPRPGDVLFGGALFGRHEGVHHFTVGQRWPQELDGRRLYVAEIDAARAQIRLDVWEALFTRRVTLEGLHFIEGAAPAPRFEGYIRVRHTRRETPACTVTVEGGLAQIETLLPLRAPAPGQPAALYIENRLLGGGFVR